VSLKLPESIEESVSQSVFAVQAALESGVRRIQVELVFQELKPLGVAYQFLQEISGLGTVVKIFFPDAGSAALARRDWTDVSYILKGINEPLVPVQPEDEAFVLVAPTSVEVQKAESVANEAGDRPFIMINPKLQDMSVVGIGYAGRQVRERFLNTIETVYYLCPIPSGLVYRSYPGPWQLFQETESGDYQLLQEFSARPSAEDIDQAFAQVLSPNERSGGFLRSLGQFLKSLSS
jgi:hypothetical protein